MLPLLQECALDVACSMLLTSAEDGAKVLTFPCDANVGEAISRRIADAAVLRPAVPTDRALWCTPTAAIVDEEMARIDTNLAAGGLLCLVLPLPGPWLGVSPVRWYAAANLARVLQTELHRRKYHLEHGMTFGGLATLGWALRSRLAGLRRRPDMVDRAEAGYRRSLTQQGQAMPAWLVWVFRKGDAL